ncbi:hypothetical protein [Bacillus sp. JJ722]|uniref:hypothetical protein n=1 Tax=Bacillus sp. JJ722 TaxID=3122973 RepID=UPI002FFF7EF5
MLAAKPKPIESLDKYMTDEAVQNVINIIDNPPAPNAYLKRAIAKFMSAKSRDNDES